MFKKTDELNHDKNNDDSDSFCEIFDLIKNNKKTMIKNNRVGSFSPIAKTKDSFGLYYNQKQPDSGETRIKTKAIYLQNKNLSNYKVNENSRDRQSRNMMPMMSAQTLNFNNPGIQMKGIMTASNFSNNEYKDFGSKSPNFIKSYGTHLKYKGKSKEGNSKTLTKYWNNYSSKRPKSAKGVGVYINASKYRQVDMQASSIYKNSMSKGSINYKHTSSSKKKHGNSSQLRKNQSIKSISTKSK